MKKVGVLSDTHINTLAAGMELAGSLLAGPFAGVEAILHAGDMVLPELESCFYPIPWYAVRGNMDQSGGQLPQQRIISLEQKRIGMIHGWGAPHDLEQRVLKVFQLDRLDVLIFGHSHQPCCRQVGSLLLMNPGSPTDRRHAPYHTVGLLHFDDRVNGEIIRFEP